MSKPRTHGLPIFAAAVLVLAAPACASMQQRVTESENRTNNIDAQVADLQATQQEIITTLTMLRADLEAAVGQGGGSEVRELQSDIDSLQEQVRILTTQLAEYEAAGRIPATTQEAPPSRPVDSGSTGGATESDEDSLFNAAYRDYTAGQYVLAVSGFEEFVARYADSSRAPDALYWIGESLAAQNEHADARRRFLEVTSAYPSSEKVPDAMLRAALEAVELGQLNDAARELRALVAAHPSSDPALVGCLQLDRLGQALPAACRLP